MKKSWLFTQVACASAVTVLAACHTNGSTDHSAAAKPQQPASVAVSKDVVEVASASKPTQKTTASSSSSLPRGIQRTPKYDKSGFTTFVHDNRLWVFKSNSENLKQFEQKGVPALYVSRIGAGPNNMTVRAIDAEDIDGYLASKPGFVTFVVSNRLWVYEEGSDAYKQYKEKGLPALYVSRIGAGPNNMTVRAVDVEIIDAYLNN